MKIRNGFVSNSSSSSFLVAFPKAPKSIAEVQQILFGKSKNVINKWTKQTVSTINAAKTIMSAIRKQKPIKSAKEAGDKAYGVPMHHPFRSKDFDDLGKYYDEIEKYRKKMVAEFFVENQASYLYVFSLGSDIGCDSDIMENADIFKKLPHIQLSNH